MSGSAFSSCFYSRCEEALKMDRFDITFAHLSLHVSALIVVYWGLDIIFCLRTIAVTLS